MGKNRGFLIIQNAFLGDLILTTPLINALVKNFSPPFYLLSRSFGEELFEGYREFGMRVISDRKKVFDLKLFYKIRREKINTVISPHMSARSAIISYLSGAETRIGFRDSALSFLYTERVEMEKGIHYTRNLLKLLNSFNLSFDDEESFPYFLKKPYEGMERVFEEKFSLPEKYALLFPSTRWSAKNWLPEGFASLSDYLTKKNFHVFLMGSEEDRRVVELVYSGIKNTEKVINLAGLISIKELMFLVERASIVLCNDSAPMHLAECFSRPLIAIFGPTSPSLGFAPRRELSKIVEVELECRPCSLHGPQKCPLGHHLCMKMISPSMVIEKCEELLNLL